VFGFGFGFLFGVGEHALRRRRADAGAGVGFDSLDLRECLFLRLGHRGTWCARQAAGHRLIMQYSSSQGQDCRLPFADRRGAGWKSEIFLMNDRNSVRM
jgi:hypothetical protein